MIDDELRAIAGDGVKVNNFQLLDDLEQHTLVCAMIRSKDITPVTALTEILIQNDALHDSIYGAGYLPTVEAYELSFHHLRELVFECLSPIIQDEIDEYNDAIDERNSEPARPDSDFK